MKLIGLLGGTFDPIHNAHLQLALDAKKQLKLDQVRFIPLNIPPHRETPIASSIHRQNMIALAIKDMPDLYIDLRELENETVSYSINTLKSLRREFANDALCFIMGRDAFNKIESWKDWRELLHYAHIIVANRPNGSLNNISAKLQTGSEKYQTKALTELKHKLSGNIYFIAMPMLNISSSMIRHYYKEGKTVDDLLPTTIQTYIKENHLYLNTV